MLNDTYIPVDSSKLSVRGTGLSKVISNCGADVAASPGVVILLSFIVGLLVIVSAMVVDSFCLLTERLCRLLVRLLLPSLVSLLYLDWLSELLVYQWWAPAAV